MIRVMINADDYGYDENRTAAILEAWRLGAITSTTMLVNYPGFEDAIEQSRKDGLFAHVGLHLNLTRGIPLTEPIRRSRLFCDETGEFNGGMYRRSLRYRFLLPRNERLVVAEEVRAQMEKYCNAGFPMMHLDSHHHVHTDFSIATIALPMARCMGFRTVRLTSNLGSMPMGKRIYKYWYNRFARRTIGARSDWFGGFGAFKDNRKQCADGSSVEVMVHPLYGTLEDLDMNGPLNDTDYPISEELTFWQRSAQDFALEAR